MHPVLEQLSLIGIVPVIKIDDPATAVPLAKALSEGGLPCAEITFRTDAAEEAIRRIATEMPDMLVGAGTVLTTDQVDRAVNAGAKFIVSPGLNPAIVRYCLQKGVPITPGTANASDIEAALELGLEVVKFFPAEVNGGINAIKALAAPYVNVKFMPTGGVSAKNLNDYLAFEKVVACGGSWMVNPDMIASGDYEGITALTREAVRTMLGFELKHMGINAGSAEEAADIAKRLSVLLGMPYNPGNSSDFAGSIVEVMKPPYPGKYGHLAIGTRSLPRARHYLEGQGYRFREETLKLDGKGRPKIIYLEDDFGGFAAHLVQV